MENQLIEDSPELQALAVAQQAAFEALLERIQMRGRWVALDCPEQESDELP